MRNILTIATILGLIATPQIATSQQYSVNDPATAMAVMLDCAATSFTLQHTHIQVMATLTALAGEPINPQLALMIASYKDLAAADRARAESYLALINDRLVPEITPNSPSPSPMLQQKVTKLLYQMMAELSSDINDPTISIDDQISIARDLLTRSDRCERLANAAQQSHTDHP